MYYFTEEYEREEQRTLEVEAAVDRWRATTAPIPAARIVGIERFHNHYEYSVSCPFCWDIHHHGAGDELTVESLRDALGERSAHGHGGAYVLADVDGLIEAAAKGNSC